MAKTDHPHIEVDDPGRDEEPDPTLPILEASGGGSGSYSTDLDDSATVAPIDSPSLRNLATESMHAAYQLASQGLSLKVPDYEILAELGRGGMGVVYKARQVRLNRTCAIKMILAGDYAGTELILRFLAEAEMVAKVHHPHIIQIHRLGFHEGRPYLELEYAEGGNLAGRLDGTPWPERRAAELLEPVAGAVAEAHRLGIVHRDLKPGNILLTADGTPKVTDFGLAKSLNVESGLTRTEAVLGSPSYMAPEQAGGHARDVGPPADVHALGAILYELLTGRPPFKAESTLETMELVRSSEPVAPDRLRPNISRDIQTICLRCLEKEPRRRYADAGELDEDLRLFLAGEPIRARPIGAAERAWRWVCRNPRVAVLVATIALVLVLGTAVSTGFAIVASRNAARATANQRLADDAARRANEAAGRAIAEARRADEQTLNANREARRANEEADTARAVSDFLVGLFEEVDPLAPTGRGFGNQKRSGDSLTAREIVDRGEQALQTQLKDRPLARATLLETLGGVFVGLGEVDKAERLIAQALEVRRGRLPEGRLELASCLQVLGYIHQIRYDPTCVGLFREALATRRELIGNDHPLTAATMFHLALSLLQTESDHDGEAGRLLEESLAIRRRRLGPQSPDLAKQLLVMAFLAAEDGDTSRAGEQFLAANVILSKVEGGHDVSAILTLYATATALEKSFGVKRAIPTYSRFRDRAEALLGRDHYLVSYANKVFAERLEDAHDFAQAEAYYRKALEGCRRIHPKHREIVGILYYLGRCVKNGGDAVRAEPILREAATTLEGGPRTPRTLMRQAGAYRLLAEILSQRGERAQSDEFVRKADAVDRERRGMK